jgi:hypothetical protein
MNGGTAEGCCVLRSNLFGVDAATLWQRRSQSMEAEWAFRSAKDEFSIRPACHEKGHRVRAHILVCSFATSCGRPWQAGYSVPALPTSFVPCYEICQDQERRCLFSRHDRATANHLVPIRLLSTATPTPRIQVLPSRFGLTLRMRLQWLDEPDQLTRSSCTQSCRPQWSRRRGSKASQDFRPKPS